MFNKTYFFLFSAAAALATAMSEEPATCGSTSVGIDGGTCETIDDINAVIEKVFFANHAVEVLDELEHEYLIGASDNDVMYTIRESQGRRIEEVPAFMMTHDHHRSLVLDCGKYCSCCQATWCCAICGFGCRRRLDGASVEDMIGDMDLCEYLGSLGEAAFEGTCMEGATITCTHDDDDGDITDVSLEEEASGASIFNGSSVASFLVATAGLVSLLQ